MEDSLQCLVGDLLSEQGALFKSTEVAKAVQPKVDAGLLTLQDLQPLSLGQFASLPSLLPSARQGNSLPGRESGKLEERLRNLARDNAQLLLNKVWELPTHRVHSELCVKLPPAHSRLPREKPVREIPLPCILSSISHWMDALQIPKAKPLTKWEEYKKQKGFTTAKKKGKVWDEASQTWKARYGYNRAKSRPPAPLLLS